jgi:divalent metal cation (Fe/Co/Zn/Cd) transporter
MGAQIAVEALVQLSDTSDPEAVQAVKAAAEGVDGVLAAGEVRCRSQSSSKMLADLKVVVDGETTVLEAKEIIWGVQEAIKHTLPEVTDVIVQTMPQCPLLFPESVDVAPASFRRHMRTFTS